MKTWKLIQFYFTPPTKNTFRASWILAIIGLLGMLITPWAGVIGLGLAYILLVMGVTMVGW